MAAKTATDDKDKLSGDTVKIKRADGAKKSSSMTWVLLLVLAGAGIAVWRLYFNH